MKEVKEILKITNYDKFKCIADKCRFTCCIGWDVSIDAETYNKWEKENNSISNKVKTKKCGAEIEYFINKENHEACPLLDEQGLCEVVKRYGEAYLSSTCHKFPRIENIFQDKKELSLSCACPEVVELISDINGKINILSENNINLESDLLELKIRGTIINIMQQENLLIEESLIINFYMLLTILENENFAEDSLFELLEMYRTRDYTEVIINTCRNLETNIDDSIEEINYLLLDIIKNYKEVSNFEIILTDISDFAENAEIENLSGKWHDYKKLFEQYDMLLENCIVSDIISSSVSSDIYEMTISFQMIILEYLLVRYAVFLRYCMNKSKEIELQAIKDYIVVFSRIIGNNTEAVKEFFKDGFGEVVMEIGYLCFIGLF